MKKIFFLLLVIGLGVWVTVAQATELGFSTSKSLFDAEILPGTTYQDEFVISNTSNEIPLPLHLKLSLWNLVDGSEEDIEFSDENEAVNPLQWFSLVTSGGATMKDQATLKPLATGHDLILAPGEEKMLRFRVKPPNDVAAGTYLVSLRFQAAVPEHYFEATGPRFIPEVATLFFLRVPFFSIDGEQTNYAAEILEVGLKNEIQAKRGVVDVAKADILDDAAKTIAAKVKNTGAFYFKASGLLSLKSWTGRVVKEIPLPGKYMLPGRVRTIEIPIGVSDDGGGFWNQVGKYVADNAYLGRYTATLILNYPQTGDAADFASAGFVQKSIQFWIFPWKFIGILAGVIGLLVIFIKQFGRRIWRAILILLRR